MTHDRTDFSTSFLLRQAAPAEPENLYRECTNAELADALRGMADGQDDDLGQMLTEAAGRLNPPPATTSIDRVQVVKRAQDGRTHVRVIRGGQVARDFVVWRRFPGTAAYCIGEYYPDREPDTWPIYGAPEMRKQTAIDRAQRMAERELFGSPS